ncbi:hypothetical protein CR513_23634, partial [Mucuna pruriens]
MGYSFYNTRQLMIEPKRKICLLITKQSQKLEQLPKFGFTISVLDLLYLSQLSPLSVMFVKFLNIIVLPFFLVIIKVLLLSVLFILIYRKLLLNLFLRLDDSTYVTWTYLMKHKSEVCQIFVNFFGLSKISLIMVLFMISLVTIPLNKMGLQSKRIVIFLRLPELYFFKCRLSTRVLQSISPIEHILSFFPSSPLLLRLPCHVFGSVAFVHSYSPNHDKLDLRAVKCIFIGYPSNKMDKIVITLKIINSLYQWLSPFTKYSLLLALNFRGKDVRDIDHENTQENHNEAKSEDCNEVEREDHNEVGGEDHNEVEKEVKFTLLLQQIKSSEPEVNILEDDNDSKEVIDNIPITVRKGKRPCARYPISQFVCIDHISLQHESFITTIDAIKMPTLVQEAMKDNNWIQAMKEEMKVLEWNSSWDIIDKPKEKRLVDCKWLYIVKCKSNGTLDRYKERFVGKGYTQTYNDIFLAAYFGWDLQHLMLKISFLHEDLKEEVYIEIPPGFESHSGLKQSPQGLFGRFA